jgi:hypothetical protein
VRGALGQAEAEQRALDAFNKHATSVGLAIEPLGLPKSWWEEIPFHGDAEVDRSILCGDCGKNTAEGECYMLSHELWAATGLNPDDGMLCLSCLETRIGRPLTIDDFRAKDEAPFAWNQHVAKRTIT